MSTVCIGGLQTSPSAPVLNWLLSFHMEKVVQRNLPFKRKYEIIISVVEMGIVLRWMVVTSCVTFLRICGMCDF